MLLRCEPDMTEPGPDQALRAFEATIRAMSKALAATLGVAAAYCVAASLFAASGKPVSPFWPASGVAVVALLLWGTPAVFGIYAGLAAGNLFYGLPETFAWTAPLGLLGESCAAALLLRAALGKQPRFEEWKSILTLVLVAPWLPALANGLVMDRLFDTTEQAELVRSGRDLAMFVLANGFGIALVAPALLVWKNKPDARWWKRMAMVIPATAATIWIVFAFSLPANLLLLPLLAAAASVGIRGAAPLASLAAVAVFMFSSWGTGPFVVPGGGIDFVAIYALLAVLAFGLLPLAAFCGEKTRRLMIDVTAGRAAGLKFWNWTAEEGVKLANSGEAMAPEELFEMKSESGLLETKSEGHDALSFWLVTARKGDGRPREIAGVLLDVSERLQMEETRRRIWQSEIELRNLRASLTPHLLFNCLAAVRGVVRTDPEKARTLIDQLAGFLRTSTDAQAQNTIALLDEWQLCEDFLALQAFRYERELPRLIEIEGPAYHAKIPPMMLLNLVENAMKHGEISQNHPLVVQVRLLEGRLEAIVRNHGQLTGVLPQREGGLGVANARLKAVYGGTASLAIRQEGTDVVAILKIPAGESPRESAKN
jgi:hypothetical protein